LVLEVLSLTPKRKLLRLGRITKTMLRTQERLYLKRKVQEPRLKLSLPIEGRGRPRDGSALYAGNVRSIITFSWPVADTLSVSLHIAPQDYDDSATNGRERQ
jgi:hypothetical protein